MNKKFEYLKEKYGVEIIFNDKYDKYNNIYTMNLVKEYLGDSYVIDADIYLWRNFFQSDIKQSTYFSPLKKNFKNEWKIIYDENLDVKKIDIVEKGSGYILSGVSYWSKKDSEIIVNELNKMIKNNDFNDYYWDDIVRMNIEKLDVKLKKLKENDIYEIDSIKELNELNYILNNL